ncbi:hypothetical protein GGS23DRAFT_129741 [Durotheca rogersii]|uniref:uncharacterized protein n=1 Tax=Durotheca rogersii TaxID=419775 RepID=UPI00221F14B1|nr:uncharacterized protein GGS23DRAFT_129741 [Durotheca rogersii]KAI5861748.1 hypothetical protein GGS23DRAFT_129741 [Durotheca rogersii]
MDDSRVVYDLSHHAHLGANATWMMSGSIVSTPGAPSPQTTPPLANDSSSTSSKMISGFAHACSERRSASSTPSGGGIEGERVKEISGDQMDEEGGDRNSTSAASSDSEHSGHGEPTSHALGPATSAPGPPISTSSPMPQTKQSLRPRKPPAPIPISGPRPPKVLPRAIPADVVTFAPETPFGEKGKQANRGITNTGFSHFETPPAPTTLASSPAKCLRQTPVPAPMP